MNEIPDLKHLLSALSNKHIEEREMLLKHLKEKSQEICMLKTEMAEKLTQLKDRYLKRNYAIEVPKALLEKESGGIVVEMKEETGSDLKPLLTELEKKLKDERMIYLIRLKEKSEDIGTLKKEMVRKLTQLEGEYTERKHEVEDSKAILESDLIRVRQKLNNERELWKKESAIDRTEKRHLEEVIIKREKQFRQKYKKKEELLIQRLKSKWEKEIAAFGNTFEKEQELRKELEAKLLSREVALKRINLQLAESEKQLIDEYISKSRGSIAPGLDTNANEDGKFINFKTQAKQLNKEYKELHDDMKEFRLKMEQKRLKNEKEKNNFKYQLEDLRKFTDD